MESENIKNKEQIIIEAMNDLCVESLSPDLFEKWEEIVNRLYKIRQSLKGLTTPFGEAQPVS